MGHNNTLYSFLSCSVRNFHRICICLSFTLKNNAGTTKEYDVHKWWTNLKINEGAGIGELGWTNRFEVDPCVIKLIKPKPLKNHSELN